ncbi:MAG TPA: hypothetical protein VMF52_09995 [Steroidobacteraceae bacterium]|nr:hypothetical protein [Steroidobacteraceae bacterium]
MNNPYAPPESNPRDESSEPRTGRRLPFSGWYAVGGGVAAGLLLRLAFSGKAGDAYGAMLASFIFGAPIAVAAVTVWLAERIESRSWAYYFFAPMLSVTLFVAGTLALNVEGWICAILILPLFAIVGGLAGLVVGAICRATGRPKRTLVSCLAMLPLLGGSFEHLIPNAARERVQTREVFVAATPGAVWREIVDVPDIRPEEVGGAWMYRIGVPLPLAARGETRGDEHLRHIAMNRGVHFDQVASTWQEPGSGESGSRESGVVVWRYRFAADSFPPGALDDHVLIGGEYFDIRTCTFTLTPTTGGTRVSLSTRYRVSTHFNWYAGWIGDAVVGDFVETSLGLYARRAERAASAAQPASAP